MNDTMTLALVAIIVLVVLRLVLTRAGAGKRQKNRGRGDSQSDSQNDSHGDTFDARRYALRQSLLSGTEKRFAEALEDVIDESRFRLLSKVRLEDIVTADRRLERRDKQQARNFIRSRHVDFLLVERADWAPCIVIELDDRSHEKTTRQTQDERLDAILDQAGLALLRVPAARQYTGEDLTRRIRDASGIDWTPATG